MALNAIDGMMAREYNMATDLGAVLNEVGDILSDCLLYLPLALIDSVSIWPVVLFSIGAIATEFCGLLGKALGGSRQYQGPMGKSDRAFFIGALAFFTAFPTIKTLWKWIFIAAALLTVWTCKKRISNALIELKEKQQC
jgi:CDP-diacylglycerol--glycerol-3-phosphate 3-phosphatidyltransferase